MSATVSDTPYPVKLDSGSLEISKRIKKKTHLSRSDILRRAIQFALPKFESGEVDILTVTPPPTKR
jgi:hypothetical protein